MHNVFISYHHDNDQYYKNQFELLFSKKNEVFINMSVQMGDIDPSIQTDTIRQKIRDEYLRDSTVTIVLIGTETWKRKHVDWEIAASIRQTQYNSRSGLLGIFLPTYPLSSDNKFYQYTIPPRLYKNFQCGYAKLYKWTTDSSQIQSYIEDAFSTRNKINPDNSYPSFANNRSGEQWYD